MIPTKLHQRIARKGSDKERIAADVIKQPELIDELIEGQKAGKGMASIKFVCNKILMLISEKKPELLYPHFGYFVDMLDWDNRFLMWGAIVILANLTTVDKRGKFEKIFDRFYAPIHGPVMVTAANIIGHSPTVMRAKPKLASKIVKEILKVEKAKYETEECRRVAIGHTLDCFSTAFDLIEDKQAVLNFAKRQLTNSRTSVVKRAKKFLKKIQS